MVVRGALLAVLSLALLGAALLSPLTPTVQANGCTPEQCLPIVPIPDVPYVSGDVDFRAMTVDVQVRDALATTGLRITLANPHGFAREATLSIPLPDGASLVAFNLSWPGHFLAGKVEERGQANVIYDEAQQQGLDAAILEEAGRHLVRLRVNVAPGEERLLAAEYVEPVAMAAGSRVYRLPLSQLDPAPDALAVDVAVRSSLGLVGLRAPALPVPLSAGAGHLDLAQPSSVQDLVLVWQEEGAERSFLVAASDPAAGATEFWGQVCISGSPIDRDVVLVLDQSGSMAGLKIEEGRQALAAALETVGPDDRYSIVLFSDSATPFAPALVAGDSAHTSADRQKVLAVQVVAGTNIDAALQEAFRQLNAAESARLPMVVFLTDGLPTVGVTDHQQIIANARSANQRHAAVHVVPIGLDADYTFLADLALHSGGAYVDLGAPDAQLSDHLARLTDLLSQPVVMDPELTIEGLSGLQVLPKTLPAIFADGCLDVRMKGNATGPISLRMDGVGADGPIHSEATFQLDAIPVEPAVRSLWGQALVADLLAQERALPSTALRESILSNAIAYAQLSPYTAWVLADEAPAPEPVHDSGSGAQGAPGSGYSAGSGTATGTMTVGYSTTGASSPRGAGGQPPAGQDDDASKSDSEETPGLGTVALLAVLASAGLVLRRRMP